MTRNRFDSDPASSLYGGARILVADDDHEMGELISSVLRSAGYRVTLLDDGKQMFDYITGLLARTIRVPPAAIVSDIRMPGLTGLDVLSGLRTAGFSTPVILITAFGDPETHALAQRMGAALVLDKPFKMNALEDALAKIAPVWS